jgi:hypothetical protein
MQRISPIANESICLLNGEVKTLQTLSEIGIYSHILYEENKILEEGVGGYTVRTKVNELIRRM